MAGESKLYARFKSAWQPMYIRRIEPGIIGEGFPDCHLVNLNKTDIFIELKFEAKPFRNKVLKIRDSQFVWFCNYPGKNAYILYAVGKDYYLFPRKNVIKLMNKIKFETFESLGLKFVKSKDVVEFLMKL